jgi:hypothetical protein
MTPSDLMIWATLMLSYSIWIMKEVGLLRRRPPSPRFLLQKAPARSAACRGLCAAPCAGRAMRAAKFAQTLLYESILAQECLFVGRLQQRGRARRPQKHHCMVLFDADIRLWWRLLSDLAFPPSASYTPHRCGRDREGQMIGSVRIVFAGIMLGLAVVPAVADDPPILNLGPTCDAVGVAIIFGRDKQACMKEETEARDLLTKNWSQYRPGDRTQCVGMVSNGGPPSYVELISCLEIMKDAAAVHKAEPGDDTDPVGSIGRQRRQTNSAPRGLYYDAGVSQPATRPARR